MIHIIDNGMGYSDHVVHFVETKTDAEAHMLQRFISMNRPQNDGCPKYKIIASAPEVVWFEGEPMPFAEFCDEHSTQLGLWPGMYEEHQRLIDDFRRAWIDAGIPEPAPEVW